MRSILGRRLLCACVLFPIWSGGALAADAPVRVMSIDMPTLIDRSVARSPNRFAVDVPYVASPDTQGQWTNSSAATSTWRHSLQIPGAVSMSFHASRLQMPVGSTLKVTIGGQDYLYSANDIRRGELWSRIGRGDTIALELNVPTKDRAAVHLDLASVQAGYRAFDTPRRNHPHYRALSLAAEAAETSGCTENWACHVTSSNAPAGQATVALVIGNVAQCTGVLLNNAANDGTPYVLTARHCENGDSNGGTPTAASAISVYWDAVTPCSASLGSIYSASTSVQWGATTVVEQQDTWLVRLNDIPVADDAYFAGWDATGAAVVGGFTAHHALGMNRQFTRWFGQSVYQTVPGADLNVGFTSTYWGTVNDVGSVSPGASGSGLFDANGRFVGTLSRARVQSSAAESPGVCPSPSPQAPSSANAAAFFTAFSGVFSSTADPKSTTGAVTLQSVLDPAHTGKQVVDGMTAPPALSFTRGTSSDPLTGTPFTLFWQSRRTQSCTASGGLAGDGWAGSKAASGSASVINYDGGDIDYVLTCTGTDGTRTVSSRVTVHWQLATPSVTMPYSAGTPYGTPFEINWSSNLRPCVASGGQSGDGWSGTLSNTSVSVVENTIGQVTLTLTCGSGTRKTSAQTIVTVAAPIATIAADVASIRIGEHVRIATQTSGRPCMASGGANGDGWATAVIPNGAVSYGTFDITEATAGTYTYVVSCGSGTHITTAQTTVTFTGGAPSVTLTASAATARAETSQSSGDPVTLIWSSNVRPCNVSLTAPVAGTSFPDDAIHGSATARSRILGDATYTATCGSGATLATATVHVMWTGIPEVTIEAPTTVLARSQFNITAFANTVSPCTATGGTAGDGWSGTLAAAPSPPYALGTGVLSVTELNPGTFTYIVTCGSGAQTVTAQATTNVLAGTPFLHLTASNPTPLIGESITIAWDSNLSSCTGAGGTGHDGWVGSAAVSGSGSAAVSESSAGSYLYQMQCHSGGLNVQGGVTVTFATNPAPAFTASKTSVSVGENVTLTWKSSDGASCMGTGGDYGWASTKPASGSFDFRESGVGTLTFGLTCGTAPAASIDITVSAPQPAQQPTPPPSVSLTASATSMTVGDSISLTYKPANVDSCTASGGNANDGWTGNLLASGGSVSVKETAAGTYTYGVTCSRSGFSTVTSSVTVTVNPQVVVSGNTGGGSAGGGGGGGGGPLGLLDLAGLAALVAARVMANGRNNLRLRLRPRGT